MKEQYQPNFRKIKIPSTSKNNRKTVFFQITELQYKIFLSTFVQYCYVLETVEKLRNAQSNFLQSRVASTLNLYINP